MLSGLRSVVARTLAMAMAVASVGLCVASAQAGELQVLVSGPAGPAANAAVSLHSPQAAAAVRPSPSVIDQRNTQFTPLVSVVHVGSRVRFPNGDNVRHQVYSFSPAKRFELPLYAGQAAPPVVFDTPGIVELGCNIHDWMVAYVVVVDTPYHAITDANGRATVSAPPGRYALRIWHPGLAVGTKPWEGEVSIGPQVSTRAVELSLAERSSAPSPSSEKLRALQEKFRKLKRGD